MCSSLQVVHTVVRVRCHQLSARGPTTTVFSLGARQFRHYWREVITVHVAGPFPRQHFLANTGIQSVERQTLVIPSELLSVLALPNHLL